MSYDDELRAHQEHLRIGGTRAGRKYLDHGKLAEEIPEPYTAPGDAQLTHDDLLGAVRELAEQHGVSSARVRGMLMLAAAKSGLGYSLKEQAAVLGEVMLTLEGGRSEVSDEQVLRLSGRGGAGDDTIGLDADVPGAGDDMVGLAGQTQETRALRLAAAGQNSASAVINRHPELSFMFRAGRTSNRKHPRRSDRMLTTDSRAHSSDTGDADPQDTAQPARGGEVHADVRRLIEANPDLFAPDRGREGEGTGNVSTSPKSPAKREREQQRAEGGHGRGERSIEDLASGSARMYGR